MLNYGVWSVTPDDPHSTAKKQKIEQLMRPGRDYFTRFICRLIGGSYGEAEHLYAEVRLRDLYEQYAFLAAENYYKS